MLCPHSCPVLTCPCCPLPPAPRPPPPLLFQKTHIGLLTIKLVSSTGEQASGILLAAAAPVTLLTALSKSSLGQQVQDKLNEKLPQLQAEADTLKAQHAGVCIAAVHCCRALQV